MRVVGTVLALVVSFALLNARLVSAADGLRTLVIYDSESIKQSHSQYFAALKEQGFTLTYSHASSSDLGLFKYGEAKYDNVILFAPSLDDFKKGGRGSRFGLQDLVDYVDRGGNVLVAAGKTIGEGIRKFANEMGVDFDEEGSGVIDHISVDSKDTGDHSLIQVTNLIKNTPVFSTYDKPVLYRGVAHVLSPTNTMTFPLVRGNPTSYSAQIPSSQSEKSQEGPSPLWDGPIQAGSELLLVSALQAANNARCVFAGSLDMFSNEVIQASPSNLKFAKELTSWTFHRRGVLRATNVRHHKPDETTAPYMYRIKDDVTYEVDIHEMKDGVWVPYRAEDVQLEYVMLDPYIRTFLSPPAERDSDNATFSTTIKTPDQYGIFKFRLDYLRQGYTKVFIETLAPLRNFKHSDYERFLWCASPYYGGSMSVLLGLLVFSSLFLYHKPSANEIRPLPKNVY